MDKYFTQIEKGEGVIPENLATALEVALGCPYYELDFCSLYESDFTEDEIAEFESVFYKGTEKGELVWKEDSSSGSEELYRYLTDSGEVIVQTSRGTGGTVTNFWRKP